MNREEDEFSSIPRCPRRIYPRALADRAVLSIVNKYTESVALSLTCHSMYALRPVSLFQVASSVGMGGLHKPPACTHQAHRYIDVCDVVPGTSFRKDVVDGEVEKVERWFDECGYVTMNRITGRTTCSLHFALSGTHAMLDMRGRTAEWCARARLACMCKMGHGKQVFGLCTQACDPGGDYDRDDCNDTVGRSGAGAWAARRLIIRRDDTVHSGSCISLVTLITFLRSRVYELIFWANPGIHYAQNVSMLMFIQALSELVCLGKARCFRDYACVLARNAYVQLRQSRVLPVAVSRCITSGSVQFARSLVHRKVLCIQGLRQIVQVVRVEVLIVVKEFTVLGSVSEKEVPRVYQCEKIDVLKCLPRCVGRTTGARDKNERAVIFQQFTFCQTSRLVPTIICVYVDWPVGVRIRPMGDNTVFTLDVAATVDLGTIPDELLLCAQSVRHGEVDVTRNVKSKVGRAGVVTIFSCLFPSRSVQWL